MKKKLILVGCGHSHLQFLKKFLQQVKTFPWHIQVISPFSEDFYSGLVPTYLSGFIEREKLIIRVKELCHKTGMEWLPNKVAEIDLQKQMLVTDRGQELKYDLLSLNPGSVMPQFKDPRIISVKPFGLFLDWFDSLLKNLEKKNASQNNSEVMRIGILGSGSSAFELAQGFNVRFSGTANKIQIVMVSADPTLSHYSPAVSHWAEKRLKESNIQRLPQNWQTDENFLLQKMQEHQLQGLVLATGSLVNPIKINSISEILKVNSYLQLEAYPNVYVSGDFASQQLFRNPQTAKIPQSGVIAVRQGQVLKENLFLELSESPLPKKIFKAPSRTLNLLTAGRKKALAVWGDFFYFGKLAWLLKRKIDVGYVKSFKDL